MASIGLRIRQPGNIGVNVSGLADSLASAFFGDAGTEMELAKMRNELATGAYNRQQMWAAAQLNEAKTATEEQNLRWRQGAIDPLTKVFYDAQGRPVAGDAGPAPVVLPESTQAIPQLRPSDTPDYVPPTSYASTEPDVQVSPANYPLRSDQPAPVAAGPGGVEPDMSFGAYGVPERGAVLPATAPIPTRRPGDMPDMASYLHGTLGVPPELLPGAQAAPVNTVRPERAGDLRPTIIDSGSPSTFPVRPELPGSLAPTGVPLPDLYSSFGLRPAQLGSNVMPYQLPPGAVPASGSDFLTLGDLWNYVTGQPSRQPEFDQPASFGGDSGPPTPFYNEEGLRNLIANGGRQGTRADAQLVPPDRPSIWSAPGPFPARPGAPDMAGPVPVDLQPRPPMETGRRPGSFPPFEPNQALEGPPPQQLRPAQPPGAYPSPSLAGVPPDLLPTPVDVPLPGYVLNEGLPQDVPPELTPMTGGTSVAVPGRNPPMPDTRQLAGVPPDLQAPAQPGGPAVTVPGRTTQETVGDRPPPVSPDYPIAPDAYPISATGDVILEPSTQTVVVHTQSGGPVRLTMQQMRGLAGGVMGSSTSAADLATGTGRMAGLLGLTYGDPNNPDQQRIDAMKYTGDLPTTSTMITSQDTAPATFEAQKAATTPASMKKNIQIIDKKAYEVGVDANGNATLKLIVPTGVPTEQVDANGIMDLAPNIEGTAAEVSYLNLLADVNEMRRRGYPVSPAAQQQYNAAYERLYGETASTTITSEGPVETFDQPPVPAGTSPPVEPGSPAVAPQAGAGAAPAPAAAAQPPAPETAPAVTAGAAAPEIVGPRMSTITTAQGKQQVKNYGGWSGEGEPRNTEEVTAVSPGGHRTVRRLHPQERTKAASENATLGYRMLTEAVHAAHMLDQTSPDKVPPAYQEAMQAIQDAGGDGSGDIVLSTVLNLATSEESKAYARALFTFMNAKLRPDTGAAISQKEFNLYKQRFAMRPGESWRGYDDTRRARADAMLSMRNSLINEVPGDQLRLLDKLMTDESVDLEWRPPAKKAFKADGRGGYAQ